ncbi:hypothetical protein FVEG_17147 [Fusarium verticillioides 7600]|uniref:Uncharacterized protein n=1 Tax=Gibberella moniliformis (strain M3125 / FGSC 7600) TaxID=334819 RepID=W7MQ80_GIBM7|nr:hypothetical protein FVEG_17147 [Fusarium verticillioides 7600]EWG53623.1 hypothetical protein FVEG_17147 [Fusarium verticillioides 7600]
MAFEVVGTKGTGGLTGAALFLLLLFTTSQTAKAAETIPATVAGRPTPRPTPRPILFSDDMPPDLPFETSVGDGASSVDALADAVSGAVDAGILLVGKVSDAVRIGRLKMITSAVGWTSVHQTSEAEIS